ncbi:MAG: hypothetical protein IPL65_07825 [Lewinellaceae bacterium]|nr:hypothetical protein [Lewinellaceae bacterium]
MPASFDQSHHILIQWPGMQCHCSCGFRTQPCSHAQTLLLLQESLPNLFEPLEHLPDWALSLLTEKAGFAATQPNQNLPQLVALQKEKRHHERLERAAFGLQDMELWLEDLMRRGLATAAVEEDAFCQDIAARMADASLPGLARTLRLIGAIPPGAPDWAEQVLEVLANVYLAIQCFKNGFSSRCTAVRPPVFPGYKCQKRNRHGAR